MAFENTPFFVGGYFRDRNQGYTVLEITDKNIRIRYDDNTTAILDAKSVGIKARIYTNIINEYSRNHPSQTASYFETLGYLSLHARFEAELPGKSVHNFLNDYQTLSEERIDINHPGIFILGEGDKWGAELRVYFPETSHSLEFGPGVQVRAGQTSGILRINNNDFWKRLVAVGFRLDTNHEVEKIRESIPREFQDSFDKGRTY